MKWVNNNGGLRVGTPPLRRDTEPGLLLKSSSREHNNTSEHYWT